MINDPAYYRDLLNRILTEEEDDDIPHPPSRQEIKLQQFKRGAWPTSPLIKQIIADAELIPDEPNGFILHLERSEEHTSELQSH